MIETKKYEQPFKRIRKTVSDCRVHKQSDVIISRKTDNEIH